MNTRRVLVAMGAAALISAATISAGAGPSAAAGNGYVTWKTAADVTRALKANGFTCMRDGGKPTVSSGVDMDGKPSHAMLFVQCDGYSVVLLRDPKKAHAIEKAGCQTATAQDWDTFAITRGLTGKNFYVISNRDDHTFPGFAPLERFQKAFGGIIETDAQFLTRMFGCHRPSS